MPEEATQVLAQFAAALTYEQLPNWVDEHCKNLLLDALACALAGQPRGEETQQVAALASSLAQSQRGQRDRRRPPLARRRDAAQRLSRSPPSPCATRTAPRSPTSRRKWCRPRWRSPSATGSPAAISWSRSPPGCEATTRIGVGSRLSGVPRPRLARTRRARPVRRGGRGRAAARFDADDHGDARSASPGSQAAGTFARVGHADGEIPPVPRRAVRADGGAARRAEIRGDTRVPHRQGRRPLQHLRRTAASPTPSPPISASAGSWSRSRCGRGRRRPSIRA